ncbi:MAG: dihydroneopterin aldolase [Flavobacteriales bacterium]|nr:dihydroneopterin aldolase [Flavobacteriales bacterium]
MGVIEVKGINVFAYHGCLEEEARIGGRYRIDVRIEGDLSEAERSDDLRHTVDYGRVTAIVHEEMSVRSALIEHVAERILRSLKRQWEKPYRWRVRLVKLRPPIHGDVEEAVYTVEG